MLKVRLIPCLLLQNGMLVRSESFRVHQAIGYPLNEVARFNEWSVDELVYLDISRTDAYEGGRADHKVKPLQSVLDILDAVAETCFMPLTFGGRVRTIDDVRQRIRRGADKVTLNSALLDAPDLVTEAARQYGAQAVVGSIDAFRHPDGRYEAFVHGGRTPTGRTPAELARDAESLGAGEIFLNSIDRDGSGRGYDLELIRSVVDAVDVPVVACGGVGRYEDFAKAVLQAGAAAVSAANIFHFKELSDRNAKRALARAGVPVRQ